MESKNFSMIIGVKEMIHTNVSTTRLQLTILMRTDCRFFEGEDSDMLSCYRERQWMAVYTVIIVYVPPCDHPHSSGTLPAKYNEGHPAIFVQPHSSPNPRSINRICIGIFFFLL